MDSGTISVALPAVLFLAANGYGVGASKLLRGLYERAVALAYMVNHPDKTVHRVNF